MRILQILPELNVGGVERGTFDLARYLVSQGHRSVVVSNGGSLVPLLEAQGTKHYQLPVHLKNIFTAWNCVKELERIIREEEIDIVHARSRVPAWIAYFATRNSNAEFVTTCHGYYSTSPFSRVMGWGKIVIVISEIIGRHMIEHFGVQPENIRLIHRSVDLDKFPFRERQPGQSSFTVVIVGRITPLKGHVYFLKAMAKVIRQRPYIRVRVVGDSPAGKDAYKDSLLLLTKRLGIEDRVEFMGNRSDIPQLLQEADALVLSTVTQEAFGRVLIEAQAVGVPVVATKVGGVLDIVEHEKTGLLVLPKDPDGMAGAILRIMNEPKLVGEMVRNARRRVEERYTLEQMASRTVEVYEELRRSMNILVVKLGAVGDIILASASFRALRQRFPQARICCLVGREGLSLLQGCPYLDDIIVYDYKGKHKGIRGFLSTLQKLRHYRFDKIIDFQNNHRSHLVSFLCMPRISYGYKNSKSGMLLTSGILDDKPDLPPVQHQFRLLEAMGIKYDDSVRLEFWPRQDDYEYARELLHSEWIDEKTHLIVGINIAASERWMTKNWPMSHLAKLCDMLAAEGIRVVITGMDKDREFVRQLALAARSKPAIMVGKTNILQLGALLSFFRCYVTSDSAPLHLAAAMNCPTVALFGPTKPERHVPPAQKLTVVRKQMECVGCYKSQCHIHRHACMFSISPEEIFSAVMFYVKGRKASGRETAETKS
ncbi:MAG: glycosyltransferase [Candidatus Omnitrophica bacterium]|nr:glycosyltransferase [Candidatus Omnitrophota bacterium]